MKSYDKDVVSLLETLVACSSVTPEDAHCQAILSDFLSDLGFRCQHLDNPPVANFYADYGQGGRQLMFAGHTDVVPSGDPTLWNSHPFQLTLNKGILYGRGVADMKGSLAAMMIAAKRWVNSPSSTQGRLSFLITSAEEGDHFMLGTPYVMQYLQQQQCLPQYCIVGEPSSSQCLGDVIKIGRRGSLTGKLHFQGKQGHVAYPHLADNPIHRLLPALTDLCRQTWDQGNQHFPLTSFQITHIQAGGQTTNLIPNDITVYFNLRYSTEHTAQSLQKEINDCMMRHELNPTIEWILSGEPFLTATGHLVSTCQRIIQQKTGIIPELSTSGGTSDGRFIAPYGIEVVELGLVNQTIHQINECIAEQDLYALSDLYYALMVSLLGSETVESD